MFWASVLPLVVILAVGTKLQAILMKMALEITERHAVVQGNSLLQASDKQFWFSKPHLIFHIIHFYLFQATRRLKWALIGTRPCRICAPKKEDFEHWSSIVAIEMIKPSWVGSGVHKEEVKVPFPWLLGYRTVTKRPMTAPSWRTILQKRLLLVHNCSRVATTFSFPLVEPNSATSTRIVFFYKAASLGIPPRFPWATLATGMGLIELRRIEASRKISSTFARSGNVMYLPNIRSQMLLGLNGYR